MMENHVKRSTHLKGSCHFFPFCLNKYNFKRIFPLCPNITFPKNDITCCRRYVTKQILSVLTEIDLLLHAHVYKQKDLFRSQKKENIFFSDTTGISHTMQYPLIFKKTISMKTTYVSDLFFF